MGEHRDCSCRFGRINIDLFGHACGEQVYLPVEAWIVETDSRLRHYDQFRSLGEHACIALDQAYISRH